MFNDPQLYQKLAKNPKTSPYLADPAFMAKLQALAKNPSQMGQELGDPRMLQVMSVLLGIDLSMGDPSAGGPSTRGQEHEEDVPMPDARPSSNPPPSKAKEPEPKPEPEPEDEEAIAAKKAKEEAEAEKKLGTENYKKRQFDDAIEHYGKAWDLHKDITYLTNLSAAKFEKGDYEGAIEACEKAIEEGRQILADFKIIAKAYARIGSSYEKMGDLANAITNYQKSLTEHRTPEVLAKFKAAEKAKIVAEKNAYVDPEKGEEARQLGAERFKEADWPDDPRGYSNRAAALIKLLAFPEAVRDCDEAIKRDPKFIRAYLRKAQALFGMKEYNKCLDVCREAMEHDEGGKNQREIEQLQQKALEAQYSARAGETEEQTAERIQRDPDIMGMYLQSGAVFRKVNNATSAILQDPVMQSILNQAKNDPAALQNHMQNAAIRTKIQKVSIPNPPSSHGCMLINDHS
jgi:stress-induced-phosphoprotein 1